MTASGKENANGAAGASLPSGPPPGARNVTFLKDPVVDHLLRAVVTLTMELSVTRERLRSLENVLDAQGSAASTGIEALIVTPEEHAARTVGREQLIHSVMGPLLDGLASGG